MKELTTSTAYSADGQAVDSATPTHPGEILKDEIEERRIKKSDFAAEINIQPGHLSEIFSGKRNITTNLALRLQETLDIDARIWLTLQMNYELTFKLQKRRFRLTKVYGHMVKDIFT